MKTTFKPNSTIPILWIIWHKYGLTFCSTHKSRGVFAQFETSIIDSVKVTKGSSFTIPKIELIFKDLSVDTFEVTISEKSNFDELIELFQSGRYQIL
jgi:hypothetical protein